jgi:hypothetical protein
MQISGRFVFPLPAVIVVILSFASPVRTFARATTDTAVSPQPKPDREKKVWTNDDFAPAGLALGVSSGVDSAQPRGALPMASAPAVNAALESGLPRNPRDSEQDPQWYAQQAASLESMLASIESQEQQLQEFRATGKGLQTGLDISAPCEGVGTDNLIAQLEARRQEILQRIDSLDDTARQNDLPPGILVEGRGRAQVENRMSADGQRAALAEVLRQRSNQLAQTQAVTDGMREEAAAKGIQLLEPSPGEGGNQTTNLLEQLDDRAKALQSEIGTVEDDARHSGVETSTLP